MTQVFNVENPNVGKNHGNPQTAEYAMERGTTTRIQRGNNLLSSSSPHATFTVQATTSHSLTLSLSLSLTRCLCTHALYNYFRKVQQHILSVCPKSYLYIYDFRVIYTYVPSNWRDGSKPGLRSSGSP